MPPEDLHVPIATDASRRAAWDILWRKLLRPLEPELADALARAEHIPAPIRPPAASQPGVTPPATGRKSKGVAE